MLKRGNRGYVEVGQLFGWIVFIVIVSFGVYYGKVLYDSYEDGNTKGLAAGQKYVMGEGGHKHGAAFDDFLSNYLHVNREQFPNHTFKEKAFCQGWDDGFHSFVDKVPR